MTILIRSAGTILLLGLGGCANTFGGVDTHRISSTGTVVSQPANVRSSYIKGDLLRAEPPPDAALQAVANATAKVSTKAGTEVEAGGSLQTSIVQLAGRTQVVLIARDAFTANCLLAMNKFIGAAEVQKNFERTLDVISTIARADEKVAEASIIQAKTDELKTAIVAKGLVDPAIAKQANDIIERDSGAAEAVARRFTSTDGKFLDTELSRFSKDDRVVKLLGNDAASELGEIKTRDDLIYLLTHARMNSAEGLANLAKYF